VHRLTAGSGGQNAVLIALKHAAHERQ
jgi:hypothetical protein